MLDFDQEDSEFQDSYDRIKAALNSKGSEVLLESDIENLLECTWRYLDLCS